VRAARFVAPAATLAMLAACWPLWEATGWLVEAATLPELMHLLRVPLLILALGAVGRLVDAAAARLVRRFPEESPHA
jgi:hypothetical protein